MQTFLTESIRVPVFHFAKQNHYPYLFSRKEPLVPKCIHSNI
jgi:hypothetical protein